MESMINFGGHDWRVLDRKDNNMLIMADKVLELRPFHAYAPGEDIHSAIKWNNCKARDYLNSAFLSRFSAEENARIIESHVKTEANVWYETSSGGDTHGRVFLLSIEEVVKYLGDGKDVTKKAGKRGGVLNDSSNAKRQAVSLDSKTTSWWLRSPGSYDTFAALVNTEGGLAIGGMSVDLEEAGLRPAIWIKE